MSDRSLATRTISYAGLGDLIPLYALYALLFADHGLSTAEISWLLVLWSGTALVLEVPSGAWADTVSRRALLVLGSLLTAAGFVTWTVAPSFTGFALGFVLWGVGGSLQSGTFQALLYDELADRGSTAAYAGILGRATSASEAGALLGILAGAPLYAWGGYALVGWVSVGVVLAQAWLAALLPPAPRVVSVAAAEALEDDPGGLAPPAGLAGSGLTTYASMLRAGIREAVQRPVVRGGVLLASLLFGLTASDEYFGLLASENGVATRYVPLLVGLTIAGSLVGSLLAGRTATIRSPTMAWAVAVAGAAMAIGSAIGGAGAVGVAGFVLIGVGYGIVTNAVVVTDARLQDAIEGSARATVTSVSGLLSELVALAFVAAVAVLSAWWSVSTVLVVLTLPVLVVAALVRRWLPPRPRG